MTPAPGQALRLLLVDDHAMFRAGLRSLLERDLPGSLVREADSAAAARAAVELERPDVMIIDISLPGEDGIQLLRELRSGAGAGIKALMLSMHAGGEYVTRAFEAGALGYVVKDSGPEELLAAIHSVLNSQAYISPAASRGLVAGLQSQADPAAPHRLLSPRQLEVLKMVAEGLSTKSIARELGLSPKTVDAHRYQISQRLQVHDVAGMVRYAMRHGLTREDR